jgi:hypothetical protein
MNVLNVKIVRMQKFFHHMRNKQYLFKYGYLKKVSGVSPKKVICKLRPVILCYSD